MAFFHLPWSREKFAKHLEHKGKGRGTTSGSWISDLAALSKPIILCDLCINKWSPKKHGYAQKPIWPGQNFVQGECDGCKNFTRGYLFMPIGHVFR